MPNDVPGDDPRAIWLNQPTEPSAMRLGKLLLRQKARELHAKTRRELFKNIAAAFLFTVISAFGIAWTSDPLPRTAFALTAAWALAGQYFLNRGMWLAPLPGDAALITSLEFCRREIEGRRRLFRNLLWWVFGPVVLMVAAIVLSIVSSGAGGWGWSIILNMAPFLALLAIWALSMIVIRVRQQRGLQREIEDQIERERAAPGGTPPLP